MTLLFTKRDAQEFWKQEYAWQQELIARLHQEGKGITATVAEVHKQFRAVIDSPEGWARYRAKLKAFTGNPAQKTYLPPVVSVEMLEEVK